MRPIYLDYNATTPVHPGVAHRMRPYVEDVFGNPSSSHWYGCAGQQAVEQSRAEVADLLGCQPTEIVFTSGGSEANNMALKGIVFGQERCHVITSQIEHPAITNVCRFLEERGTDVTYLPVDEDGRISPEQVRAAVRPNTRLISIMLANNEVGTIQPVREISEIAAEYDIVLHTDAAQAVGKWPVRVDDLGVDLLSLAGHKFYAPKGIGALYIKKDTQLEPLIHGAGHERGRWAGTENVMEIVGLGAACRMADEDLAAAVDHMAMTRDRLRRGFEERLGSQMRVHGSEAWCLPNTASIGFSGIVAHHLLDLIDDRVAVSAGSACHAGTVSVSSVLEAMSVPLEFAAGTIRFSTGRMTTSEEIDRVVDVVYEGIMALNK